MVRNRSDEADDVLLRRTAMGDDEAFAVLYRRHRDPVLAYFRRRVPEPDLAFDLCAETFAVVIADSNRWRDDGPVTAWLYGIARNLLRESLRAGRVADAARARLGMEPVLLDDADLEAVEERAAAGAAELEAALDALPEPTRRALLARVVEGREYADIAVELRCSEQLVRQRVHRGIKRLRADLKGTR